MIIGRSWLAPPVRFSQMGLGQMGLDWYSIDRRWGEPGQAEIACGRGEQNPCGIPPRGRGRRRRKEIRPYEPAWLSARSIALNTWLGRNGFGKKPSGSAIAARRVVSSSARPDRKIAGIPNFWRSTQ